MNPYGYIAIGVIALAVEVYAIILMERTEAERRERLANDAELRQIAEHYANQYPATLTQKECDELNAGRWD
jgi:cytochrome c553